MIHLRSLNEWFKKNSDTEKDFSVIVEYLKRDCSEFLELMKIKSVQVFRGQEIKKEFKNYSKIVDGFWKFENKQPRKSRDTKDSISKIFDDEFQKNYGVRLRANGVFTSKDLSLASNYGESYLFIPTNGFRYFWNPKIEDLFNSIRDRWWYEKDPFFWDSSVKKEIKSIADGYIETGIENVKYQEITFICDSYYLLDLDYYDDFITAFGINRKKDWLY